jgi:hypothetical protein
MLNQKKPTDVNPKILTCKEAIGFSGNIKSSEEYEYKPKKLKKNSYSEQGVLSWKHIFNKDGYLTESSGINAYDDFVSKKYTNKYRQSELIIIEDVEIKGEITTNQTEYSFKDGLIIKIKELEERKYSGVSTYIQNYKYNKKGKLIKSSDDWTKTGCYFEYDRKDRLISQRIVGNGNSRTFVYEYDEDLLVSINCDENESSIGNQEFCYDSSNRLELKNIKSVDGWGRHKDIKCEYFYDGMRLVNMVEQHSELNIDRSVKKYRFDKFRNNIETEFLKYNYKGNKVVERSLYKKHISYFD